MTVYGSLSKMSFHCQMYTEWRYGILHATCSLYWKAFFVGGGFTFRIIPNSWKQTSSGVSFLTSWIMMRRII